MRKILKNFIKGIIRFFKEGGCTTEYSNPKASGLVIKSRTTTGVPEMGN